RRRHTRFSRDWSSDVCSSDLERYPLPPFARTVGFSATTTISRKAFGIDAWPGVIGDAVALRIEAEAQRVRGDVDTVERAAPADRSEERRVGKGGRARESACQY